MFVKFSGILSDDVTDGSKGQPRFPENLYADIKRLDKAQQPKAYDFEIKGAKV